MEIKKQNPGVQAGASRNQLGGWLQFPFTATERQAQMLACRFRISTAMAQELARHCFGEAAND